MAFTPAGCISGLAAVLATVPNIGNVHQQRRRMLNEQEIKRRLWDQAQGKMIGWMISPSPSNFAVTVRGPGHHGKGIPGGGGNNSTVFQFQIEGYHTLDDAADSETVWTNLVWTVAKTINSYGLLDIEGITHQNACQVEQVAYVNLAGLMFLHYCRIDVGFQGMSNR